MSYTSAESNDFGEFQMKEGFKSAVTGIDTASNKIGDVSKLARAGMNSKPAGLQGYENYPESYAGYEGTEESTTKQWSALIKKNYEYKPAGLQGTSDDAFAGYEFGDMREISSMAKRASLKEGSSDVPEFDGYGSLADAPLESFHTFFHNASVARTEWDLIKELRRAVKAVADDTPASVKKDYYDMIMEMIKRRKTSNLRYLDLKRVEIDSNVGWLINPSLPKTGGFDKMVQEAVGVVGSKLGKNTKDEIKMKRSMELSSKLKDQLKKTGDFAGLGELSVNAKYAGLGLLGLLIAGLIWYVTKSKG